jgi:hypothetical protein
MREKGIEKKKKKNKTNRHPNPFQPTSPNPPIF